jgi:prepilin-type N-terminal cleavage/methylation domain-containing protein
MNKRQLKGFTMVELLVAMAIIGMLIAVAIWGISLAQQSSRNTARKTAGATILAGMSEFYSRYNKQPTGAIANAQAGQPAGSAACVSNPNCVRLFAGTSYFDVNLTGAPITPYAATLGNNVSLWYNLVPVPAVAAVTSNNDTGHTIYELGYDPARGGYKVCVGMEDLGWANMSENSSLMPCP